jgi:hypothetical protein
MTDKKQERKCPGEVYVITPVVCRERQRRGWGKCRVCQFATLEEVTSIAPAPQKEEPPQPRRRPYYLLKKTT